MKIKHLIILIAVFIISITFLINNNNTNNNLISIYINNTESTSIPDKDSDYIADKVVCDNNASASWDNNNWNLFISNLSKRSNCKIYFRSKKDITITYDNNYVKNNIFETKFNSNSLSVSSTCADNTYLTHTQATLTATRVMLLKLM